MGDVGEGSKISQTAATLTVAVLVAVITVVGADYAGSGLQTSMITWEAGWIAEIIRSEEVVLLTGAANSCRFACLASLRTFLALLKEGVEVSLYTWAF